MNQQTVGSFRLHRLDQGCFISILVWVVFIVLILIFPKDNDAQTPIIHIISFGVDSIADNKENMTKMEEEYATPSKRGALDGRSRHFGSSKSNNSSAKQF